MIELENLAEDVRQALLAVEAEQHAERAADPYLLDGHPILGMIANLHIGRCRFVKFGFEALERVGPRLDPAVPRRPKIVRGDGETPRRETPLSAIAREVRDDSDEDLLRRVTRVLGMPKHAKSQRIDLILDCLDELLDRRRVAGTGVRHRLAQRINVFSHRLTSSFSRSSSDSSVRTCLPSAPSICSSGRGG